MTHVCEKGSQNRPRVHSFVLIEADILSSQYGIDQVRRDFIKGYDPSLLALLTEDARQQGVRRFRSYVSAPNERMIEILQQLGSERRGREGSLVWFETPLRDPEVLPDTPAGRVFRAIAAGGDPPSPQ